MSVKKSAQTEIIRIGERRSVSQPTSHCPTDIGTELEENDDIEEEEEDEEEEEEDSPSLGRRSVSLTTLQSGIIQPRMAQLETLEAKMASIEVSLSSTPRRRKNGSIGGMSLGSMRSIPREIATKELENLRNALRDKENIIRSLKGQLTIPGLRLLNGKNGGGGGIGGSTNSIIGGRELTENEKKQAEERLDRLKTDVDNKRLAIKNLKMALERLDITDNIDVRIQQAELEYQLGREELNLLTLLEETRALQLCLDESKKTNASNNTLFNYINGKEYTAASVEIDYDPKNPKFGAGEKERAGGLYVDWALEETGLVKDDRIVEVNGKIVLTRTRDDLSRLLAAAPDPAQIVVLRSRARPAPAAPPPADQHKNEVMALRAELDAVKERAEEAQRCKDGLRTDNLRLTHRISYLEEQVAELLGRKIEAPIVSTNQNVTNINITSSNQAVVQPHQKNSSLISNPGPEAMRSKSSLSNVSSTDPHTRYKHKTRSNTNGMTSSCSTQTLDQQLVDKITYRKHPSNSGHHHHHYRERDYNSETNSNAMIEQHRRSPQNPMDQSYQKATKIVKELTRRSNEAAVSYEKHRQKCLMASEKYNGDLLKHYNARKSTSVLDFRSEIHIGPKYGTECKSADELCDSDGYRRLQQQQQHPGGGGDQMKSRPAPPKKPLRLSLHKAQSLQSVEANQHVITSGKESSRKSLKRSYKNEMPKWNFSQSHRRILENGLEMTGSWC